MSVTRDTSIRETSSASEPSASENGQAGQDASSRGCSSGEKAGAASGDGKPRLTPAAEAARLKRQADEAGALRANLMRRKAQARARAGQKLPAQPSHPDPETS
ncbi:hypothetical protein GOB93_08650 [Acetobacter musti]|uniref:Transcriptional regulator n=1 Tax=Acetobacter musti TaxID=864732 RepID=A0ABX0JS28_9PROT|nr:hypothetical protein [Acetobacter musti]NHN84712.1 hypothetical protein [Acetobacter musti]